MSMQNIIKNFRDTLNESDDSPLYEVEGRPGLRNYKIVIFVKIDKKANIDITQVFNKIRAIPGVTTLKQDKAVIDRGGYWLSELGIKFNTRGIPNKKYIYNVLVKQINDNSEISGVPGTKVYGINWQAFREVS